MTLTIKTLSLVLGASTVLAACDGAGSQQFAAGGGLTYADVSGIYSNLSATEFNRNDANKDGVLSPTEFSGIDNDDIQDVP